MRLILPTSKYSRYICLWRNKGSSFHFLCSHLLSYSKLGDKELPRWLNKTSFLSGPSDISPSDFLVSSHFIVKQRVTLPRSSCQNIPVNPLCWYSTHKLLEKGRVELGKYLIHETWAKNWKQIFVLLKVRFHHEGGLSESRYFELFFSTRYEAPPHKKSAFTEPPFLLFLTFGLISSYFVF